MDWMLDKNIPQMLNWIEIWGIWRIPLPSATITCSTKARGTVHVKVTSTWMLEPIVSQKIIAQNITFPPLHAVISPWNKQSTLIHPPDLKAIVINQTRRPSSIAPWSSSDAHMPILSAFRGKQQSSSVTKPQPQQTMKLCALTLFYHCQFFRSLSCSRSV